MKTTLSLFALVTASVSTTLPTTLSAQEATISEAALVQSSGAQERIALSGKLRMISQRIPAMACHFVAGVDPEGSSRGLALATDEFEKILSALEFGDAELGVNDAELDRKTIAKIHALRDVWTPFKVAADAIVVGDLADGNLQIVLAENMNILETAKTLVTEISGEYANPAELVQADSFLIDIAGRQRMLLQKISKESCMVSLRLDTAASTEALNGSIQVFSSSLEALRHGMPSAGIRKPPTSEISAGLDGIFESWKALMPTFDAVLSGAELDATATDKKYQELDALMVAMNDVVIMYSEATKNEL